MFLCKRVYNREKEKSIICSVFYIAIYGFTGNIELLLVEGINNKFFSKRQVHCMRAGQARADASMDGEVLPLQEIVAAGLIF